MSWKSIADLLTGDAGAPVALLGAPMEAGSVTPGRCDLAPDTVRRALKRFSTFDLVDDLEIGFPIHDAGDVAGADADAGARLRADPPRGRAGRAGHELVILLGGNNAVTRPAAHALGLPLAEIGLITFDAHFDMRETDQRPDERQSGPLPARGRPAGRQHLPDRPRPVRQYARCTTTPSPPGSRVWDIEQVLAEGIETAIDAALEHLSHVEAIMVDFDIDVIDRAQLPGAPGARPGGLPATDFFRAARRLARGAAGPPGRPDRIRSQPRRLRHQRVDRRPLGLRNPRRLLPPLITPLAKGAAPLHRRPNSEGEAACADWLAAALICADGGVRGAAPDAGMGQLRSRHGRNGSQRPPRR